MAVSFFSEGIDMPAIRKRDVSAWIRQVAQLHGKRLGTVCYKFVDDEGILACNRQYLQHDFYTDIITFDYSEGDKIAGDIIIGLETVRSNAEQFGQPFERELHRVIIHGILHLCGIDDKAPGEREIMEQNENEALALYFNLP
jgi:rRNA maturation RNase YbeY